MSGDVNETQWEGHIGQTCPCSGRKAAVDDLDLGRTPLQRDGTKLFRGVRSGVGYDWFSSCRRCSTSFYDSIKHNMTPIAGKKYLNKCAGAEAMKQALLVGAIHDSPPSAGE